MNIIKIEKIEGKTISWNNKIMYPVKIQVGWFRKKTLNLFPTDFGPTFGGKEIVYLEYVDAFGKEFYNSKQINNYVKQNQ